MKEALVLLVEGPSDVDVIKEIVIKIGLQCKIQPVGHGGRGPLLRLLSNQRRLKHFAESYEKVIVLLDSHCTDPRDWETRIEEVLGPPRRRFSNVHYYVVKHAIETWLIADEIAVNRALSTFRLAPIADPENDCTPEETLERASTVFKNRYHKTRHPGRIARHLDLDKVATKCPGFRRFRELVLSVGD